MTADRVNACSVLFPDGILPPDEATVERAIGVRPGDPLRASFGVRRPLEPGGPILVLEHEGSDLPPPVVRMQAGTPEKFRRSRLRVVAVVPRDQERC